MALPEVLEQYSSVGAELNVLPFCSQFIPMEVITAPKHQSICYHPSLLPRHRGASSINWYGGRDGSPGLVGRTGAQRCSAVNGY